MNTGASWPSLIEAESRVLAMQTKLHQWAISPSSDIVSRARRSRRPGQAFQRHEHMESRMRRESHVRFGGRAGETHRSKGEKALRSDPTPINPS